MCQYKNIYITIGSNGREYILNILMRHPNLVRAIFYHLGLDNLVNEVSAVCSAKNLTKFEHSSSSKHPELLEVQMRKLWYNYLVGYFARNLASQWAAIKLHRWAIIGRIFFAKIHTILKYLSMFEVVKKCLFFLQKLTKYEVKWAQCVLEYILITFLNN